MQSMFIGWNGFLRFVVWVIYLCIVVWWICLCFVVWWIYLPFVVGWPTALIYSRPPPLKGPHLRWGP